MTVRRGAETRTLRPVCGRSGVRRRLSIARQAGLDGESVLGAAVSSYLPTDGNFASPTFLFGEPEPGYSWVFPMGLDASNVGVFALSKSAASAFGPR